VSRRSNPPRASTTGAKTILVAEPDVLVRMVIAEYLRECGYKVIEALTADDVMTILTSGRKVDAVFSEVKLRGDTDGFGLAQRVRANYPDIKIILTTGVTMAAERAGELCDDGPLPKPYHPKQVVQRLKILFEKRRTAGRSSGK
jgi:CheY-like chemotaxis protein